jgi:signal transduction histidine kinase
MNTKMKFYSPIKFSLIIVFILIVSYAYLTLTIQSLSADVKVQNEKANYIEHVINDIEMFYQVMHESYLFSIASGNDYSNNPVIILDTSKAPTVIRATQNDISKTYNFVKFKFIHEMLSEGRGYKNILFDKEYYHTYFYQENSSLNIFLIQETYFMSLYTQKITEVIDKYNLTPNDLVVVSNTFVYNRDNLDLSQLSAIHQNELGWTYYSDKIYESDEPIKLLFILRISIVILFILTLIFILYKVIILRKDEVALVDLENTVNKRTYKLRTDVRKLTGSLAEEEMVKESLNKANLELKESIFELKATQKQLIETEKMASLGSLVAGVAHEINTPLGNSLTSSTFLKSKIDDLAKKFENGTLTKTDLNNFIDKANESNSICIYSLKHAADLVKSFKRIAVDQSNEQKEAICIKEYLELVITSLKHESKKTPIEIHLTGDKNLVIDTYPGAFSQIISNLIMNSFIHGFKDKSSGHIWVHFELKEKKLILIFKDNGHGIPRQYHKKIFDPFFSTNRHEGGSGLGLNIVYNIVSQRFGGSITLKNNPGGGAKFTITFPIE